MQVINKDKAWLIIHSNRVVNRLFTSESAAWEWADDNIDDQVYDSPNTLSAPIEYINYSDTIK